MTRPNPEIAQDYSGLRDEMENIRHPDAVHCEFLTIIPFERFVCYPGNA